MIRKITLLFVALAAVSSSFAQIVIDHDYLSVSIDPSSFSGEEKTYLHNNATDPDDTIIVWKVTEMTINGESWESSVCTGDLCVVDPAVDREYKFDLSLGEKMLLKLGFTNVGNPGTGTLTMVAWSELNPNYKDTVKFDMYTWGASTKSVRSASFDVYPNPAKDFITIELMEGGSEEIKIYDILGNEVLSQKIYSGDRIDVASLPKGIYIMRSSGNLNYSKTIQKI